MAGRSDPVEGPSEMADQGGPVKAISAGVKSTPRTCDFHQLLGKRDVRC